MRSNYKKMKSFFVLFKIIKVRLIYDLISLDSKSNIFRFKNNYYYLKLKIDLLYSKLYL